MCKRFLFSAVALLMSLSAFAGLPSVSLKNLDGKTVELKAIAEVYDEWQEETGVKLIAVSIDEAQNEQKVKPLVESKGWEYEVLLDPNGEFKRQLGVNDIPHVFVVDGQGNIVWNHQGYVDGGEEDILEAVKKAAEKK